MTKIKGIEIEEQDNFDFWVIFWDENGESVLAKCKTVAYAKKRAKHFRAVLRSGKLLREDKSVWTR